MSQPLPWQRRAARGAYVEHLKAQKVLTRELAAVLRDAAISGERVILQTLSDPANVSQAVRRSQYQSSVLALRQAQAELWGEVTRATRAGIERASAAATTGQMELLAVLERAVDENALGGRLATRQLLDSMTTAARLAAEDVRSRIINNIPLSDRVYRTRTLAEGWVQREVNRGIALQRSAREIATSVRHMIRPDTPGGVSYAAMRLGRTELNNAFHATEIRQGQELPWVEAYKWELSGSHPREDECDDYAEDDANGLGIGIWPKEQVPSKPHPQCLCFLTTITVSPSAFYDRLLSGGYDGWLQSQGVAGIRATA